MTEPNPLQVSGENPFRASRRKGAIKSLIFGALAITVLGLFLFFYSRAQKTGILILDSSADLKLSINGKAVGAEKTDEGLFIPLYAGNYRLAVEKPNYQTFTQDIAAKPGKILRLRPIFPLLPAENSTATEGGIAFVRASPDQKVVYYLGDQRRHLFRMEVVEQQPVRLTDRPLQGVQDVEWSDDPNVALIVQSDGVYLHEIPRFDYRNQIFLKVAGPEVISPMWDPKNSGRLAAIYEPPSGEHSLVLTDKQFSNLERLVDTRDIPHAHITWSPNSTQIALIARNTDSTKNDLWIYTLGNGDLKKITDIGGIQDATFSPDGSTIVYERRNEAGNLGKAAYVLASGERFDVAGTTPLSSIAWKDSASFYEPGPDHNSLVLQPLRGQGEVIPISLPVNTTISSMNYFADSERIVFSTGNAIYVVSLGKQ